MNARTAALERFGHDLIEELSISVLEEDVLTMIAARSDVWTGHPAGHTRRQGREVVGSRGILADLAERAMDRDEASARCPRERVELLRR